MNQEFGVGAKSTGDQSLTTWKILALALCVSLGLAEWSKRSAAKELVIDEKILEHAIQIAVEQRMEIPKIMQLEKAGVGRPHMSPEKGVDVDAPPALDLPAPAGGVGVKSP